MGAVFAHEIAMTISPYPCVSLASDELTVGFAITCEQGLDTLACNDKA
jgi:hypothetical protein